MIYIQALIVALYKYFPRRIVISLRLYAIKHVEHVFRLTALAMRPWHPKVQVGCTVEMWLSMVRRRRTDSLLVRKASRRLPIMILWCKAWASSRALMLAAQYIWDASRKLWRGRRRSIIRATTNWRHLLLKSRRRSKDAITLTLCGAAIADDGASRRRSVFLRRMILKASRRSIPRVEQGRRSRRVSGGK